MEAKLHSEPTTCSCQSVADWAQFSYSLQDVSAEVQDLSDDRDAVSCVGRAVVVPSLHRIECVLDDVTDFAWARDQLQGLTNDGWSVWALVPLGRLGEAHQAFSDTAECVQGWWPREELGIAFAKPEIA